ncbi:4-aminobutyrate aminotransferase [Phytophthora nicotianae]|uniref:4-aminobutyrate aminotransferase n=1 Tax=Phytophthora nicotianae TaxID=4792 RepID=A0A0W8DSD0_PHYNI|nr:4-aminobutyrate aminotransferase [Phytophthora nicotianae]
MPRKTKPPPAKKKPRLTDRERGRIEGLHEGGVSGWDIARITARSRDTVRRVISPSSPSTRRNTSEKAPLPSSPTARPGSRANSGQGEKSAAKLKTDLKLSVSVRTIQRTLSRVDWLVYSKMENTLPLKSEDMLARKAWASAMLARKDAGAVWVTIIFSDEKKWNLDGPDSFQRYWRDLRQPPRQTKRRQAEGGSVMVWVAFSSLSKSPLAVLVGKQNSDDYVYTVSEYLFPFAHLNYGTGFIYQQDNASIPASKRTEEFFAEQDVNVLDRPSKSPDLNPIENLWSIISRKVYGNGKQFDSVAQLKAALFEAWALFPTPC